MFLDKIRKKSSGILLYGITPPKTTTSSEKVAEIAEKTLERLYQLPLDALVVYDVQDESARTNEVRPFPYVSALDPLEFTVEHLHSLSIPKIIYRPAGKFTEEELTTWLAAVHTNGFFPVFVGVPSPDFVPKTSLPQAYQLWSKHADQSVIGAVTIPERHAALHDEDQRMLQKMSSGVSFFISQCVFDVDYSLSLISDIKKTCSGKNHPLPTIIFTLTACGSTKTLSFMEWLGIHIPDKMKEELMTSENILQQSVDVCLSIAQQLINHCVAEQVPFGFNIESVAIRKEEIEASIAMVGQIKAMLAAKNL